jgi:hypothetical protein
MSGSLYPILAPQQPVRPFWMGDCQNNMLLEFIQGDAFGRYVVFPCDCFTPNITNYLFLFTIKASMDPADPDTLLQTIWTEQNGGCGITALILLPSLTSQVPEGRYAFDLKYQTPSGYVVQTCARGQVNVLSSTNTTLSPPQLLTTSSLVRRANAMARSIR